MESGDVALAHRLAWILAGNAIPAGHEVRHRCESLYDVTVATDGQTATGRSAGSDEGTVAMIRE